jgi:hypothetical protein
MGLSYLVLFCRGILLFCEIAVVLSFAVSASSCPRHIPSLFLFFFPHVVFFDHSFVEGLILGLGASAALGLEWGTVRRFAQRALRAGVPGLGDYIRLHPEQSELPLKS